MKLIILDFDGTLGDTRANIVLTMTDTMRSLGLPVLPDEDIAATIGLPLEKSFATLYPDMGADGIAECCRTYRATFERNRRILVPTLFPGVRETLAELQRRGYVLTVASSRRSGSLGDFLVDMKIKEFISYVLGADNVAKAKPDPEPVLMTLRAFDCLPEEALVVGDMPVDILMGVAAGTHTCAVTYGNAAAEELSAAGAEFLIDDMSELIGDKSIFATR